MGRFIRYSAVLWLLCLSLFPLAARAEAAGSVNDACVDGDSVYLLNEGILWEADALLNKEGIVHRFDSEDVCGISVVDGVAYYCHQDASAAHFARLDLASGETAEMFSVATERPLYKMLAHDGIIYVLWEYRLTELMERDYTWMCVAAAYDEWAARSNCPSARRRTSFRWSRTACW